MAALRYAALWRRSFATSRPRGGSARSSGNSPPPPRATRLQCNQHVVTPSTRRALMRQLNSARLVSPGAPIVPPADPSAANAAGAAIPTHEQGLHTSPTPSPPPHAVHVDDLETERRRWAVLPASQLQSKVVSRLWMNRFLQIKQEQAKATADAAAGIAKAPPAQRQVLEKRMRDSYVEEIIPFRSEPVIKEDYVNVFGRIRMGKILEDLDALSGSIAYLHCDDNMTNTSPFKIVTASLDRLDLLQDIPPDEDVRMSGMVTYVGTSSMEISIMMETMDPAHSRSAGAAGAADADGTPGSHAVDPIPPDAVFPDAYVPVQQPETKLISELTPPPPSSPLSVSMRQQGKAAPHGEMQAASAHTGADDASTVRTIMMAKFTMVALDSETGRPATVNRLLLETPEERRIARIGQMHKKRKQELAQRKTTQALTESEMRDLHAVLAHPPRDDPSAIWMGDTEVQSLTLTYPQNRNIHSNIFGGYLMRRAFELGYANALMALKVPRVYFTALDDITFNAPVPIGCLLNLTSHIVYAPGGGSHTLQCTVRAEIIDPVSHSRKLSNEFNFTFLSETPVPRVIPRTYAEGLRWIEGRRRHQRAEEMSQFNMGSIPLHSATTATTASTATSPASAPESESATSTTSATASPSAAAAQEALAATPRLAEPAA